VSRESRDDVDELFGRLEPVEPPPGLVEQVLRRTAQAQAPARHFSRELAWGLLDATALVALTLLSVSLGWTLAETGGVDVLRAVLENLELLVDARGEFLLAVVEALPWLHLVGLALDLAAVYVLSRLLVGELCRPGGASRDGVSRR